MVVDVDLLRWLYAHAPSEFVAARNAKVKELKGAGEREAAAAVAALRRHTPAEWALDVASAEEPDPVRRFAARAGAVRDAQASGQGLREALRDLRDVSAELTRAVVARSGVEAADVAAALAAAATSEAATAALLAGTLGAEQAEATDPLFGVAPPEAPAGRRRAAEEATAGPPAALRRPSRPSQAERAEDAAPAAPVARRAPADDGSSAADRRRAERERAALEKAAQRAARELDVAEEDLRRARARSGAAQAALAEATERAEAAAQALTEAEGRRAAAAEELEDLRRLAVGAGGNGSA